jgi:3alpha(or 20beta)-hydroxysteroid dehydrogenase
MTEHGTGTGGGRLAGKVALITGAARGQGRAEAELFAAEGASVVAADVLDVSDLDGVHLDVTSAESWAAAVAVAVERHGRVDVLVNNAGIYTMAAVDEVTEAEFRRVLDVNLVGPFLGIQAVIGAMPAGGSIINVSSLNGLAGSARTAAYTSSKFGLRGLTRATALDLGPRGIRVNAVLPGVIRTPMVAYAVEPHEEGIAAGLPLRRIGEPLDVASAALFLASDESSWMTGSDVTVDGGQIAGMPRLL